MRYRLRHEGSSMIGVAEGGSIIRQKQEMESRVEMVKELLMVVVMGWLVGECLGSQPGCVFSNVFGDNMVLQRDTNVRVWGYGGIDATMVKCILYDSSSSSSSSSSSFQLTFY